MVLDYYRHFPYALHVKYIREDNTDIPDSRLRMNSVGTKNMGLVSGRKTGSNSR